MELAKDWRTDRVLRRLEAMLLVADRKDLLLDLRHGRRGRARRRRCIAIGSGGSFAYAAARALPGRHRRSARARSRSAALRIAADICIYTNREIVVEELA